MAAQEFTWQMTEILAEWRKVTGVSQTSTITDNDVYKWINDYYCQRFPLEIYLDLLHDWFTQSTSVDDSGKYSLGQTTLKINEPVMIGGTEIQLYYDKGFFTDYPDDEQFITEPTLAIGSSDTTKVKNSDFTYDISGYSYSKTSAENTFSGLNTVPQNKYGAFSLKIDSDGTVTIAEADDNSDGYDTAGEAVAGLAVADSDSCYMGFVTVISTDSGGFVPGTTALDDSAVTDTYTDGKHQNRGDPESAFIFDEELYIRPKADRILQIKAPKVIRPTALDTTDAPLDVAWGPAIALGAGIEYIFRRQRNYELAAGMMAGFDIMKEALSDKQRRQHQRRYASPSF